MRLKRPVDTTDYSPTRLLTTGELGVRPLLRLAVELEVDTLVEEAEQVANRFGVVLRLRIRPDDVLDQPLAEAHVPVGGRPLVRAAAPRRARDEQLGPHVVDRDVVARRQPGLEQRLRASRVG